MSLCFSKFFPKGSAFPMNGLCCPLQPIQTQYYQVVLPQLPTIRARVSKRACIQQTIKRECIPSLDIEAWERPWKHSPTSPILLQQYCLGDLLGILPFWDRRQRRWNSSYNKGEAKHKVQFRKMLQKK